MNIIIKPSTIDISKFIEKGINVFLLPLEDYSVEYTSYFTMDDIKTIKSKYPTVNLFVSLNKNIFNDEIDNVESILLELDKIGIKAIFYYDLAFIKLKKDLDLNLDLVWNQTHMVTNYKTCDYYYSMGVKYALLSKEITKDEIITIINKSSISPIVELITYPSVGFSKRRLITNYYKNLNKNTTDNLLVNEKVSKSKYYLKENKDGTIFIKNQLVNGCSILEELIDNNLPYILLKEDLINEELFLEVVGNILYFISNYKNMNDSLKAEWLSNQNELLGEDTGFFFKKTIYKVK